MAWFKRSEKNISTENPKHDVPDGMWIKCDECGEMMHKKQWEANSYTCIKCGYHFRIGSEEYFNLLFDEGSFKEYDRKMKSVDTLKFTDSKPYDKRIEETIKKTELYDALRWGTGEINKLPAVICAMDFAFIGGSMGSVLGEKISRAIDKCLKNRTPLIIISSSGGARMMEGGISLMQLAKISSRLAKLAEEKIPYISLITNPTTGGASASFAMQGDLNIAEPNALIGFAGPRVIKQATGKDLPKGFQRSDFVLEHGFLDLIVDRKNMKEKLAQLLNLFAKKMKVIREIKPMQEIAEFFRRAGKTVGFVPTMGFLHEGHVALMLAARDECDVVIASIFVNPTQFLPNEDFAQYPRDFLRDFYICKQAGVDYIFNPSADEMYGENYKTYVNVEDLSEKLEGKYRPGHFKGVATVVMKLFNICKPHYSYFGQKDAQQVSVLKKTVKDLNLDVTIRICETIREDNGLAKSSRNTYLSDQQKEEAAVINKSLQMAKEKILANEFIDAETLKNEVKDMIETKAAGSSVQYVAITDNELLNDISDLKGFKGDVLVSLAVYSGKTRLIDNILFTKG